MIRAARLDVNTALLAILLGGGVLGGVGGKSKLEEIGASVARLDGKLEHLETAFVELRTKVAASEQLNLDLRLRALEQLGTERRLEALERETETTKKGR